MSVRKKNEMKLYDVKNSCFKVIDNIGVFCMVKQGENFNCMVGGHNIYHSCNL